MKIELHITDERYKKYVAEALSGYGSITNGSGKLVIHCNGNVGEKAQALLRILEQSTPYERAFIEALKNLAPFNPMYHLRRVTA